MKHSPGPHENARRLSPRYFTYNVPASRIVPSTARLPRSGQVTFSQASPRYLLRRSRRCVWELQVTLINYIGRDLSGLRCAVHVPLNITVRTSKTLELENVELHGEKRSTMIFISFLLTTFLLHRVACRIDFGVFYLRWSTVAEFDCFRCNVTTWRNIIIVTFPLKYL